MALAINIIDGRGLSNVYNVTNAFQSVLGKAREYVKFRYCVYRVNPYEAVTMLASTLVYVSDFIC